MNRVWSGFKNQARKDDLVLYHWVRGSSHQEDEEYAFAKYNQEIRVPKFDEKDYEEAFRDVNWSYKETSYLFELCRDYDLRWVVLHDRYNYEEEKEFDGEEEEGEEGKRLDDVEKKVDEMEVDDKEEEEEEEEDDDDDEKDDEKKVDNDDDEEMAETMDKKKDKEDEETSNRDEDKKNKEESQLETKTKTSSSTSRTIEDLKDRFYTVCRALLKLQQTRSGTSLSPAEEDLYKQMIFSKSNEIQRKAHLESLLKRSPAEIAEEEALVIESRKLEAAAERMLTERAELLRLLDAPQASGSIAQHQSSQGLAQLTSTLLTSDKTRKRKETSSSGPPSPIHESDMTSMLGDSTGGGTSTSNTVSATATTVTTTTPTKTKSDDKTKSTKSGSDTPSSTSTKVKSEKGTSTTSTNIPEKERKTGASAVAQLIQKKLTAKEEAAYGISYHDKIVAGVHLRSSKITTLKATTQAKVAAILNELGLPSRPTMPTAKVTAKFESLQQSINVLLEAKKQLDKLDTEVRILRTQQEQSK